MNFTLIDDQLWLVRRYLMRKVGCDAADRAISPLSWYIETGRAPLSFLRWFVEAKPFLIGRILMNDGSDEDIINMLKAKAHTL